MTIQKYTENEREKILILKKLLIEERKTLWNSYTNDFHQKKVDIAPAISTDDIIFCAIEADSVVAFISGTVETRTGYVYTQLGIIDELFVEKAYRQNGIASLLLKAITKEFQKRGVDHLIVKTDAENIHAQQTYEKNGFAKTTIEYTKKTK